LWFALFDWAKDAAVLALLSLFCHIASCHCIYRCCQESVESHGATHNREQRRTRSDMTVGLFSAEKSNDEKQQVTRGPSFNRLRSFSTAFCVEKRMLCVRRSVHP
jgi:hypothetical protein